MAIDRDTRRGIDRALNKVLRSRMGLVCVGDKLTALDPYLQDDEIASMRAYAEHKLGMHDLLDARVDEDMYRLALIVCYMTRRVNCGESDKLLMTATLSLAIAARQGRKEVVSSSDPNARMPLDKFIKACQPDISEHVLGRTYEQVLLSLCGSDTYDCENWLKLAKDLEVADVVITQDVANQALTAIYYQMDTDYVAEFPEHSANLFYTTALFAPLLYSKYTAMKKELSRAKRKQSERKPTKKQSDVIVELKAELASTKEKLASASKAADEKLQSATLGQSREMEAIRKKLERAEATNAELQQQVAELLEEQELQEKVDEAGELPELPDTGVVFVGGHTRLLRYLRSVHPNWEYKTVEAAKSNTYGNPTVVFLYTRHVSHSAQEHVHKEIGQDRVLLLRAGTNLERLERTMQYLYATRILKEG